MNWKHCLEALALCLILFVPSWIPDSVGWSTTCAVTLSLLIAGCMAVGWMRRGMPLAGDLKRRCLFLIPAAVFLLLLIVQTLNSGRIRFMNFATSEWDWSPPPVSWLPSSFERAESFQMIAWFLPCLILVVLLRRFCRRHSAQFLVTCVCLNATLLGLVGLFTHISGAAYLFGQIPHDGVFFATFGYPNHAAQYFLLMFALAGGMCAQGMMGRQARSLRFYLGWGVSGLLFASCAFLSASRYGMLAVSMLLVLGVAVVAMRHWDGLHAVDRINMGAYILGGGLLFGILIYALSTSEVLFAVSEALTMDPRDELLRRSQLHQAAIAIWLEQPVFGAGGWGFRYLLVDVMSNLDPTYNFEGKANVHNDYLQFLAEFGLLGTCCLLFYLVLGFVELRKLTLNHDNALGFWLRRPLAVQLICGFYLILFAGFVDLPFRSPVVILHFTMLLAILPFLIKEIAPSRSR